MKMLRIWGPRGALAAICIGALGAGAFTASACGQADAEAGGLEKPSGPKAPAAIKKLTLVITGMT